MSDTPTQVDPPAPGGTQAATPSYAPPTTADAPLFRAAGDRYEIGELIASGGMGAVHRGRDAAFGREVAVKLLLDGQGADSPHAARFFDEARIAGQLQHPGIPPVYDVGTLPDGRPFLAMKLIRGKTLDKALQDGDRLDVPAVFEGVCRAVGYAHAHGVIHRDLKPANVMVGAFAEVQVMDWGLAKVLPSNRDALRPEPGTAVVSRRSDSDGTVSGQAIGSPPYMPPEQARGLLDEIDPRSDVFGLGGILCALLTGRPVFAAGGVADTLLMAAGADTAGAFARLDGSGADPELVALCKRCLSGLRSARPADGTAVAEAVAALRAAADERARQAERERAAAEVRAAEERKRRRVWYAVAGALLAGVIGSAGFAAWAVREADRAGRQEQAKDQALVAVTVERDAKGQALAEAAAARDQTVVALRKLTDELVQDRFARRPGLSSAERRYLREVLALWQSIADARGGAGDGRELQAEGAFRIGFLRYRLGDYAEAERSFRTAARDFTTLLAADPGRADHRELLAATWTNLGHMLTADRRLDDAAAAYRAAVALADRLADEFPDRPDNRLWAAGVHNSLAVLHSTAGRPADAEAEFRRVFPLLERLAADHPDRPVYRDRLAEARLNWGALQYQFRRLAEAETAILAALDAYRKLTAEVPSNPDYRERLAGSLNNLGSLRLESDRTAEAEAAYRAAIEQRERLVAAYPARPDFQDALVITRHNLGDLLVQVNRPAEAEAVFRAARQSMTKLADEYPLRTDFQERSADARVRLGNLLAAGRRYAEADDEYRAAIACYDRLAAGTRPDLRISLAGALLNHANVLRESGRNLDSLPVYGRVIHLLHPAPAAAPAVPPDRLIRRNVYWGRALALGSLDRPAEAVADWDQAVLLSDPADRPGLRYHRSLSLARAGRVAESVKEADELSALPVPRTATDWYDLACVYGLAAATPHTDREKWRNRAVELLRKAVAGGYSDAAHMWKDPDLDPLRSRPDFRQLLADLGAAREPAPTPRPAN